MSSPCCVIGCGRNRHSKYCFPNPAKSSTALFDKWVNLCGNKKLKEMTHEQIYRNCRVCALHFRSDQFGLDEYLLKINRKGKFPYPLRNLPEPLEPITDEVIPQTRTYARTVSKTSRDTLSPVDYATLKVRAMLDVQLEKVREKKRLSSNSCHIKEEIELNLSSDVQDHSTIEPEDLKDFTPNDLNNENRCLRTIYTQEKATSRQDTDETYKPHLNRSDSSDALLHNIVECRESLSNMVSSQHDQHTIFPNPNLHIKQEDGSEQDEHKLYDERRAKKIAPTSEAALTEVTSATKSLAKKSYDKLEDIEEAVDKLDKIASYPDNNNKEDDDDEFDIFGKSVAIQLRQLPLVTALNVETKIQGLIRQERLRCMGSNSPRTQYIETPLSVFDDSKSSSEGIIQSSDVLSRDLLGIDEFYEEFDNKDN